MLCHSGLAPPTQSGHGPGQQGARVWGGLPKGGRAGAAAAAAAGGGGGGMSWWSWWEHGKAQGQDQIHLQVRLASGRGEEVGKMAP